MWNGDLGSEGEVRGGAWLACLVVSHVCKAKRYLPRIVTSIFNDNLFPSFFDFNFYVFFLVLKAKFVKSRHMIEKERQVSILFFKDRRMEWYWWKRTKLLTHYYRVRIGGRQVYCIITCFVLLSPPFLAPTKNYFALLCPQTISIVQAASRQALAYILPQRLSFWQSKQHWQLL